MTHDHVQVAVEGSVRGGQEFVPAQKLGDNIWRLLRSPLYALQLAAGDTIRMISSEVGAFEVVARGGNVAVQFYLAENESDNTQATARAVKKLAPEIVALGGRMDGHTAGLIVYTIPIAVGFPAIEKVFESGVSKFPGAQWQYSNVYDAKTGEPLGWWEQVE